MFDFDCPRYDELRYTSFVTIWSQYAFLLIKNLNKRFYDSCLSIASSSDLVLLTDKGIDFGLWETR